MRSLPIRLFAKALLYLVLGMLLEAPVHADVFLTFDEIILGANGRITNEYAEYGVTFTNAFYDVPGWDLPTGRHIANFNMSVHYSFMDINFSVDVAEADFLFTTNRQQITGGPPGRTTFQALLDGQIVDEFVGETDLTQRSFGFSGKRFDQVRVFPGGAGRYGRLDDLRYVAVPEPNNVALFASALVLLIPLLVKKHARTSVCVVP
ncbi:MAG: hypothetical protein WD875_05450 [Pirellulales bacterium]